MLKRNKNIFFLIFCARQGLTLVLRILIQNEKSGLHSSLKDIWKNYLENDLIFGGELDKDWPCSYISHKENQGSHSS